VQVYINETFLCYLTTPFQLFGVYKLCEEIRGWVIFVKYEVMEYLCYQGFCCETEDNEERGQPQYWVTPSLFREEIRTIDHSNVDKRYIGGKYFTD
jgi:hypothetical protein